MGIVPADLAGEVTEEFCCDDMRYHLSVPCQLHMWWECPDVVVHKNDNGVIGIPIHDGGSSFIAIDYCPWCGKDVTPL